MTDRDTQRQRLYRAEKCLTPNVSAAARRLLVDAPRVASTGSVTIEACQAYVDHLTQSAWFQRRWGRRHIEVRHKVYGKATGGWGVISLPPWSRNEAVILHEVAHNLAPAKPWHGPEFAGVFLALVEHRMGKAAGTLLRAAYKEHRVRLSNRSVPKPSRPVVEPRTRVILPTEAAAAKQREVNAAAHARRTKSTAGFNFLQAGPDPKDGFMFWFGSVYAVAQYVAKQAAGLLEERDRPLPEQGVETTSRGAKIDVVWQVKAKDEPGVYAVWIVDTKTDRVRHHATVVLTGAKIA